MCQLEFGESTKAYHAPHLETLEAFETKREVQYETAPQNNNGDLLDAINNNIIDSDVLIRTYFHQFISALENIHSQGIAHLNLKLENLVLLADFMLEIENFENAQYIADGYMETRGSQGYRAQEVINEECEDLEAADIYSAGVILFALKAKKFPFVELDQGDCISVKDYPLFVKNNEGFWRNKNSLMGDDKFFDEQFKRLINGMLERNVAKRFTIEQIKESEWFKGPVMSEEELKKNMRMKYEAKIFN